MTYTYGVSGKHYYKHYMVEKNIKNSLNEEFREFKFFKRDIRLTWVELKWVSLNAALNVIQYELYIHVVCLCGWQTGVTEEWNIADKPVSTF